MVTCPNCGSEYDYIGVHWSKSCGFPELTQKQKSILSGLLLGDAYLSYDNNNPRLVLVGSSKEYLSYTDEELSWISSNVRLDTTSEQSARRNRKSGFDKEASASNYSDIYKLYTRSHPYFNELSKWYADGKSFPIGLTMDNEMLRHWIACDGNKKRNYIRITANNFENQQKHIAESFNELGFPVSRFDTSGQSFNICFDTETSKEIWDSTEPVVGYEYKWK